MKALVLVLALAFAPAFAAEKCRLPPVNVDGLDYHTARGRLINADQLPKIPMNANRLTANFGTWTLGYLEGDGCITGSTRYFWHGFTVEASGDCFQKVKVTCP